MTDRRDHGVLKGIVGYRAPETGPRGERVPAPFGVYAEVDRPGRIVIGEPVLMCEVAPDRPA